MREGSAYRNVVEGDAGLGHLLELRLVAREVHGPAHGAHRAETPAAAAGAPEQEEQAAEGDEGEQQVATAKACTAPCQCLQVFTCMPLYLATVPTGVIIKLDTSVAAWKCMHLTPLFTTAS